MVIVRVGIKPKYDDVRGNGRKDYIESKLGIPVGKVSSRQLYTIEGISDEDAKTAAERLLTDKVVEQFEIFHGDVFETRAPEGYRGSWLVRVGYKSKPLVLDAWGDATRTALIDLGIKTDSVRHAEEFLIEGELTENQIKTICKEKLADEKVQQFSYKPVEVSSVA